MERVQGLLTATYHSPCQLFALERQHSKGITVSHMPAYVRHQHASSHAVCKMPFKRWASTELIWPLALAMVQLSTLMSQQDGQDMSLCLLLTQETRCMGTAGSCCCSACTVRSASNVAVGPCQL